MLDLLTNGRYCCSQPLLLQPESPRQERRRVREACGISGTTWFSQHHAEQFMAPLLRREDQTAAGVAREPSLDTCHPGIGARRQQKIGGGPGYIWGSGAGFVEYVVPERKDRRRVGRLIVRALSGSMRDKKLSESRCKPSRMDRTASGLVNGLGRGPALPRMRQAPCGATRGRPVSRAKRALA